MDNFMKFVSEDITNFLDNKLVQSVIIFIIAVIASKILKRIVRHTIKKQDMSNRTETITRVITRIISAFIYFMAFLSILQTLFNVQPASLIAATGIFSVALGFGAQSLFKDVISGFFILIENQFAVGDLVTVEGFNGTVCELTLRTTIIRNCEGDVFTIPNGSITKVTNHSRGNRGVFVVVSIAYEEDIDNAIRIMKEVAEKADHEMEALNGPPQVLGVSALGSSGIDLKMLANCVAGEQFAVERELLKRIKYAFDAENVDIPYNHIVVVNKEDTLSKK